MKRKNFVFGAAITLGTVLVFGCVGCSDELSKEDAAWVHQQRMQQQYGSSTVTSTSTVVNYVTVTSTSTVTQ